MEKKTFYKICISILIAINLGTIAFFYLKANQKPPRNPTHRGPRDLIVKEIGFDKQQEKQYDSSIVVHRQQINILETKKFALKNNLYQLLKKPITEPTVKDSIMDLIAQNSLAIENVHFNHFMVIKSICKGKIQLKNFAHLSTELARFFAPKPIRK
jgi:periplasmic protein CpxP/Spy